MSSTPEATRGYVKLHSATGFNRGLPEATQQGGVIRRYDSSGRYTDLRIIQAVS